MKKILLILIFLLGTFLRFNGLDKIPPGLNRDEVSVGYNAYSILQTGKDEHGRSYPFYFEAIGDQKLPAIIYSTVPSIKLFGLSAFGVRFPFAFLGSLTVLGVFLLARYAGKETIISDWFAYLSALLIAINPWHIYHSRAAYEVCIGLFFFTFGAYFFLKGLRSFAWMLLSITFFTLAMYSYSLTRLLSPLLFTSFVLIYRDELKSYSRKLLGFFCLYVFVLLLPFILTLFDSGGITSPKGAILFTSSNTKVVLMEFRSYLAHSSFPLAGKIFFNSPFMFFYEYLRNILSALSLKFLFVSGAGPGGAGIGTIGQFYMHEILAILLACLAAIHSRRLRESKFFRVIFSWVILVLLCASLTINPPDSYASRMYFTITPMMMFIALGWIYAIKWLCRKKRLKIIAVICLVFVYFWHCTYYLTSYYLRFPVVYAQSWDSKTKELFSYLKENEDNVDYIVITKPEKSRYAFQLFYQQIPPQGIEKKLKRYPADPDGWKHVSEFGKYQYRSINWNTDNTASTSAILVSQGDEYLDHMSVSHEIYYHDKNLVYANGQDIIIHPERPIAFRIWHITPTAEK